MGRAAGVGDVTEHTARGDRRIFEPRQPNLSGCQSIASRWSTSPHSSHFDSMRSLRVLRTVVRPSRLTSAPGTIAHFSSLARQTVQAPRYPAVSSTLTLHRSFHQSHRRQDVFFLALPALKSSLLNVTRFTLIFLPFVFRYKLWKKYKKTSYLLIQIPVRRA